MQEQPDILEFFESSVNMNRGNASVAPPECQEGGMAGIWHSHVLGPV